MALEDYLWAQRDPKLNFPGTTANVVAYGHLGDGNLHLNISTQQYDDSVTTV